MSLDLPPSRSRLRLWRDVLAAVLMTVGLIGLVVVCFTASRLAGWAMLCAAAVAVGAALGYERE